MKMSDLRPLAVQVVLPSRRTFRGPFLLGVTVGVALTAGAIVAAALSHKKSPSTRLLDGDLHDHPEGSEKARSVAARA
jgi:hypothetical protein